MATVMTVGVREATQSDFQGFVELFEAHEILCVLGKEQGNHDWERLGRAYVATVLATELRSWEACCERFSAPGGKLWVIEDEGRVIGSVGAVQHDRDCIELVRMYVDAGHRRRGHASMLVKALFDHARGLGVQQVKLTTPQVNEGGIKFYMKQGFKADQEFATTAFGLPLRLVQLVQW
eukprot:CAMPEP_0117572524 /NCGR_PEP_ID=MMETSP0784-20121206/60401_1 /TAXON_ID=39447 /ORGANISM="" /LENGTH=177 /DNA_ID=CAMNT_0005370897 /DNA_START=22 /DNA_END=552 /DNA_ORIENTATION=+